MDWPNESDYMESLYYEAEYEPAFTLGKLRNIWRLYFTYTPDNFQVPDCIIQIDTETNEVGINSSLSAETTGRCFELCKEMLKEKEIELSPLEEAFRKFAKERAEAWQKLLQD